MLKIVAIGNLTNDVELKVHEATGKPYAILRIASDRRYRDKDGNRLTASGDFETITFADEPERQPGFLIKATEVEFLSPRRVEESAVSMPADGMDEAAA